MQFGGLKRRTAQILHSCDRSSGEQNPGSQKGFRHSHGLSLQHSNQRWPTAAIGVTGMLELGEIRDPQLMTRSIHERRGPVDGNERRHS